MLGLGGWGNRHQRQATWSPDVDSAKGCGPDRRWRAYRYDELEAALEQFRLIPADAASPKHT